MEGKKRMALILTVKPGEDDYLDTSYLLRQASPYMHIKFTNVEQANLIHNKRHIQTLSTVEQAKRMKYSSVVQGTEGVRLSQQDSGTGGQQINKVDSGSTESGNSNCNDFTKREKSFQITQNLAKALWSVLKQCNQKLKMAEKEIQSLSENLGNEKMKYVELEKEFEGFKSSCNCSEQNPVDVTLSEPETQLQAPVSSGSKVHDIVDEENTVVVTLSRTDTQVEAPIPLEGNKHTSVDETTLKGGMFMENCKLRAGPDEDTYSEIKDDIYSPNFNEFECNNSCEECGSPSGQDKDVFSQVMGDVQCLHPKAEHSNTPQDVDAFTQEPLEPPLSEVKATELLEQVDMPGGETRLDASRKPLNLEKPKRRLLPASSILLRDIAALGIEDEHQRPKGNGGGRKLAADETKRTQGSISLLRLLQDNLHL